MDTYKKVYGKPAPKSRGRIHPTALASRRGGGVLLRNDKKTSLSVLSLLTVTSKAPGTWWKMEKEREINILFFGSGCRIGSLCRNKRRVILFSIIFRQMLFVQFCAPFRALLNAITVSCEKTPELSLLIRLNLENNQLRQQKTCFRREYPAR